MGAAAGLPQHRQYPVRGLHTDGPRGQTDRLTDRRMAARSPGHCLTAGPAPFRAAWRVLLGTLRICKQLNHDLLGNRGSVIKSASGLLSASGMDSL